jgi:hypothetical protein
VTPVIAAALRRVPAEPALGELDLQRLLRGPVGWIAGSPSSLAAERRSARRVAAVAAAGGQVRRLWMSVPAAVDEPAGQSNEDQIEQTERHN